MPWPCYSLPRLVSLDCRVRIRVGCESAVIAQDILRRMLFPAESRHKKTALATRDARAARREELVLFGAVIGSAQHRQSRCRHADPFHRELLLQ